MDTTTSPGTGFRPAMITAAAALLLAGAGPSAAAAQAAGSEAPADSVEAVVHAFHEALAAGDSAAALELLHPEVTVYEGGHAETLSEYRSGHLAADMSFSAAVDREILSERAFGDDGWAVYLSEYRMAGTFRGKEVDAQGTETMVLVRTDAGWRIRHIHWSSR